MFILFMVILTCNQIVGTGPKVIKVTSPTSQMRRVYLEPLNTNVNLINARQLSTLIRVLHVACLEYTMQIVTKPSKLHPGNLKKLIKPLKSRPLRRFS